jgi:hypothetical protein
MLDTCLVAQQAAGLMSQTMQMVRHADTLDDAGVLAHTYKPTGYSGQLIHRVLELARSDQSCQQTLYRQYKRG